METLMALLTQNRSLQPRCPVERLRVWYCSVDTVTTTQKLP
jgi:hypothetical protein